MDRRSSMDLEGKIFAALLAPAVHALRRLGEGDLQRSRPGRSSSPIWRAPCSAAHRRAPGGAIDSVAVPSAPASIPTEKRVAVPFVVVLDAALRARSSAADRVPRSCSRSCRASDDRADRRGGRRMLRMTTTMFLAFGAAFETQYDRVSSWRRADRDRRPLLKNFPYTVLACFIISAVLTPSTDSVSQERSPCRCRALPARMLAAWLFAASSRASKHPHRHDLHHRSLGPLPERASCAARCAGRRVLAVCSSTTTGARARLAIDELTSSCYHPSHIQSSPKRPERHEHLPETAPLS